MLPFRVVDCYQNLVAEIRGNRLNDAPGQYPKDDHAAHWAGFLAHYLEDNTQPQHATIDYKSSAYFANKRKAPNVHAQVEYDLADDEYDDHTAAFARSLAAVREGFIRRQRPSKPKTSERPAKSPSPATTLP